MQYKNILIVEDDQGIREALQTLLEFEGYEVVTAANGKEGLEQLKKITSPCLILLDLMMPVMNGWEFAQAMKSDMVLAQIPIVIVTAFADMAKNINAPVIKKPVDIEVLTKMVKIYCDKEIK